MNGVYSEDLLTATAQTFWDVDRIEVYEAHKAPVRQKCSWWCDQHDLEGATG